MCEFTVTFSSLRRGVVEVFQHAQVGSVTAVCRYGKPESERAKRARDNLMRCA